MCAISLDGCTTSDGCNPTTGECETTALPDGAPCEDFNLCTGSGTCQEGTCLPGISTECQDDGNPCTAQQCDPYTGQCTTIPLSGNACEDGDECTGDDTCFAGDCLGGEYTCCIEPGDSCVNDEDCCSGECTPQRSFGGGICDGDA